VLKTKFDPANGLWVPYIAGKVNTNLETWHKAKKWLEWFEMNPRWKAHSED